MPKSRPLLERLLNTADLATIVPHLQPEIVHRVIQRCGLEDCAGLIAVATPAQISGVLDVDLWSAHKRGGDEEFDADRFGVWLETLMQSGAAVAAQKIIGLDIALVTTGLSRHVAVFSSAAVSSYTSLDGGLVPGREPGGDFGSEIGGYVIRARRTGAWDAIVALLEFLDSEHPQYFHRVMRRCLKLSNGTREADGFHDLLQDREQDMFDLAADRQSRRDTRGYVSPADARAFLQASRQLHLNGDRPSQNSIARAYFGRIEAAPPVQSDPAPGRVGTLPGSGAHDVADIDATAIAAVLEILQEAGVVAPPRALLESGAPTPSHLALIQAQVASRAGSAEELAFLANTLVGGCSIQGRAFTPQEAADAAAATGNLGLQNWPTAWLEPDLITAFQVGWTILHRDVCMFTADRLIEVIAHIRCRDREIQLQLNELGRVLTRHRRDGAPWRAQNALDVIMMLDAPSWAALLALLGECPVMHAAVPASQRRCLTIDAGDFEFISQRSQIAAVHEFVESLPSTLTR